MSYKTRGFGGSGRSFGGGGGVSSLGFPPFTRAIKWLVITNAAIFLLLLIVRGINPTLAGLISGDPILVTAGGARVMPYGALVPYAVLHGWIWQLVTYLFLHDGLFHILFNMLTLWMFGSALESAWGDRQFLEFYSFCGIGAAFVTIAISYIVPHFPVLAFLRMNAFTPTVGASGAIFGVMVAFAMYYGNQEFMMFPLPFMIKAKYLVAILIFISVAYALGAGGPQGVAQFAHLGGAFFGWLYVRFIPRKGLTYLFSERYFGVRNSYYKWKRRRAARKFEVYMRKTDRTQYFDQYGNYRPPDEKDKPDGEGRGPWVN